MPEENKTKPSPFDQDGLLYYLITDEEAAEIISTVVPLSAFESFHQVVFEKAVAFRRQYKKVVGDNVWQVFDSIKKEHPNGADVYDAIYKSLRAAAVRPPDKQYLLDRAHGYARLAAIRNIHDTLTNQLESYRKQPTLGKLQEMENTCASVATRSVKLGDPGLNMADPKQALSFLNEQEARCFPTGIAEIDRRRLGPTKKELQLFIAGSGRGKSWYMANLALQSVRCDNAPVAIITLEMSESRYMQRLNMALFGIASKEQEHKYIKFARDEQGRPTGFQEKVLTKRRHFESKGAIDEMTQGLLTLQPNIRVKAFPTGTLTIEELESQFAAWEWQENWSPGLVLLDYPDLMAKNFKDPVGSIDGIYERLRGMAISRDFALVCPTQIKSSAEGVKWLGREHVAKSVEKYNIADSAISLNASDYERKKGLARLYQCKGRNEGDQFKIIVSQAYSIGQFVMDSAVMNEIEYNNLVKGGGDES